MTKAYAVLDGQWGSTGKGLIAGYLALTRNPDTAVCNFGPNAGHTVVMNDGREVMTQMLPSAIVSKATGTILLGPGAIIDPKILAKELDAFSDLLVGKKIYAHCMATVVKQEHKDREAAELNFISSTCKGTGAAQVDKVMRVPGAVARDQKDFPVEVVDNAQFSWLMAKSQLLQIESAQGMELGFSSGGWYPYCTSRDVNVYQVLSDCGIPYSIKPEVIVSMRTFPIRVGDAFDAEGKKIGTSGPVYDDMQEVSWGMLGVKEERTTVTKKIRRVFTFSIKNLEKVIEILCPDMVFLNFTNYLDVAPEFGYGNTGNLVNIIDEKWRHLTGNAESVVKWIGVGPKVQDVHSRPEVDFIDEGN
jgi:adenylosuccinate synthase